jgi:ribosomal protein S13
MKFEHLLRIYWSRGFLYGGKLHPFASTFKDFFEEKPGLYVKSRNQFVKRFELDHFALEKEKLFTKFPLDFRKVINMYLSQITSINSNLFELIKYTFIRLYLIRTFRGRCSALGKPIRGQRTRSNASTTFKCNRVVRLFISQVKKNNVIEKKQDSLNLKFIKKRVKKQAPKIKMVITKKNKNLWF